MPPRFVEIPEKSLWSQSIGGFIINFGMAELLTLRCVELLSGKQEAMSIRKMNLSMRIKSAKKAIEGSEMPGQLKERALCLWSEIELLSKIRNRIAHNPLLAGKHAATGQLIFSVVDLRKMTPDGRNQLDPLIYQEIAAAAVRIRDIVQEISLLIEPASDDPST